MNYVLENTKESERLEKQAENHFYSISHELESFSKIQNDEYILDAGCGSGLTGRYLLTQNSNITIDGCDSSQIRLQQAWQNSPNINFFQCDLSDIPKQDQSYDRVICRYVLEHVNNPLTICNELLRVIKPGGQVCVIDLDGIIFNLYTENTQLNNYLQEIKEYISFDLHIGRKIPGLLKQAGFKNVSWEIQAMGFTGEDLLAEYEITKSRLQQAYPLFVAKFGNQLAQEVIDLYLRELLNPNNTLFYNKFLVSGQK